MRCGRLWLGGRGYGAWREWARLGGGVDGVVLAGEFSDERPQGRIGREDAVVAVTVDSGWGEDCGEAVQELKGGEAEGGASGQVGLGQDIEDLVGAAVDEVESVESKGRPGTIPNEPLQAGAVGGFDADAPIEAEPAAVIPAPHILGFVGFQQAVAAEVAEHPFSHRMLEVLQKRGGEGGGFVEAELGIGRAGIGVRLILDPLEEPVDNDDVKVEMRVQRRAEAVQEAGFAGKSPESWSRGEGKRGRGTRAVPVSVYLGEHNGENVSP